MNKKIDLSIIIALSESNKYDNISELYHSYKKSIEASGLNFEFIYVTDRDSQNILNELFKLKDNGEKIEIIELAKWFGDAAALNAGFEQSYGEKILTLPGYRQIDEKELLGFINSFENVDMLTAVRSRGKDNFLHRLQAKMFHYLVKVMLGMNFNDLGCVVRIFNRELLNKIYIYGDQHRFLPILASRSGFKVKEYFVSQYYTDLPKRIYSIKHYIDRFVNFISIFFLVKFTKKPLRFFGFPGIIIFSIGSVLAFILFIQRAFLGMSLADRPLILLSILLIVFGIQLFAIGLVAEIIIFTHSKDTQEYIIEEIYQSGKENNFIKKNKQEVKESIKT
ncbi:MAG: glycosyltransferase [Candidatus Thorarchaeota archaeon]